MCFHPPSGLWSGRGEKENVSLEYRATTRTLRCRSSFCTISGTLAASAPCPTTWTTRPPLKGHTAAMLRPCRPFPP
eukprot:1703216-Pyramimonas_sp.AAC.2